MRTVYAILCVLTMARGRFFRGTKLKSSEDYAGVEALPYTHEGDIYHKASDGDSRAATIAYITQDVALNLGFKLPDYIARQKQILKQQLDTGVTFCGAGYERSDGTTLHDVRQAKFDNQHRYKDSAVKNDGVVSDAVEVTAEDEVGQCGSNSCRPGSVVYSLANFIRSQGYHIRHEDICEARAGTLNTERLLRTCNLDVGVSSSPAYSCPSSTGVYDQWKYDKECAVFGTDEPGTAGYGTNQTTAPSACDGAPDCAENDALCVATSGFLTGLGCVRDPKNDIVPLRSSGGVYRNQVKRVLKYGVLGGEGADIENSVLVTGSAAGCVSLRGIVLALNGAKMEEAFVRKQYVAAEAYWKRQLDDVSDILSKIISKITNLKGLGNFFYPFEDAEVYQCDSNFAPFEDGIDRGSRAGPKCDLADVDRLAYQQQTHVVSMAQRSNCFCRSMKADNGDTLSVDEVYLSTTNPSASDCAQFRETLPSVYTFCMQYAEAGDAKTWRASLNTLMSNRDDMPSDPSLKLVRDDIVAKFDASIVGSGNACGRVSSADPDEVSFSNKGGNCIPIVGVDHIVYRLEYEFFGESSVPRKNVTGPTYADIMCEANTDGDQILSFRQMAYQWQRFNASGNGGLPEEGDTNADTIDTEVGGRAQLYDANTTSKCSGGRCYEPMCSVDYAQLLGGGEAKEDAGRKVADPLDFYQRVASEAAENVHRTFTSVTVADNSIRLLWERFEMQLTDTEYNTQTTDAVTEKSLVADIGEAAADHFMRVAVNGDDTQVQNKIAMCAKETIFTSSVGQKALKDCERVETITSSDTMTAFTIGVMGLYGSINLDRAFLPPFTKIERKGIDFVKDGAEILFKTTKYGRAEDNMTVASDPHGIDTDALCGVHCDADYKASSPVAKALCDRSDTCVGTMCDLADLNSLSCQFDRERLYRRNVSGSLVPTFVTQQVTRDTVIACEAGDDQIKVMEFYLGSDCKTLTLADLTLCTGLTHIYLHDGWEYRGYGVNDARQSCSNPVNIQGAVFPKNLQLLWSTGVLAESVATFKDITTVVVDQVSARYAGLADTVSFTDNQFCDTFSSQTPIAPDEPKYGASQPDAQRQQATFDVSCWQEANERETASVHCYDVQTGAAQACSSGTTSTGFDREVTCAAQDSLVKPAQTLTCWNGTHAKPCFTTSQQVQGGPGLYFSENVSCTVGATSTVCAITGPIRQFQNQTWSAMATVTVNASAINTLNLPFNTTVNAATARAGQQASSLCEATVAGTRSLFNASVTTYPHGVTDITTNTSLGVVAYAVTSPVFAVPVQQHCPPLLQTNLDQLPNLDTLYGSLDCAIVSPGTYDIVRCMANASVYSDTRRHRFVAETPFDLDVGEYTSLEFKDTHGNTVSGACDASDIFATASALRDGSNAGGLNYCALSYSNTFLRLDSYTESSFNRSTLISANSPGSQAILVGGDGFEGSLSQTCVWAKEVVVPDSVRYLGVGFLFDLDTDASVTKNGGVFTVYVGERLKRTLPPGTTRFVPAIDDTANMMANDPTHVALIRRRCPTTNVDQASHPAFAAVTDSYRNTFSLNSVRNTSVAVRKSQHVDEAKYYEMESGSNCVTSGH